MLYAVRVLRLVFPIERTLVDTPTLYAVMPCVSPPQLSRCHNPEELPQAPPSSAPGATIDMSRDKLKELFRDCKDWLSRGAPRHGQARAALLCVVCCVL